MLVICETKIEESFLSDNFRISEFNFYFQLDNDKNCVALKSLCEMLFYLGICMQKKVGITS